MNRALLLFVTKKLTSCIFSMFVIITLSFLLMKVAPGDPLTEERAFSPEIYESLKNYYGLNKPLAEQYFSYLYNIAAFDLGPSLVHSGRTVSATIIDAFPVSGLLGLEALIIASVIGIVGGTLSALKKNCWLDDCSLLSAILFLSIPNFILGAFLQYIFGIQCAVLPVARWGSWAHTIMPAIALAAAPAAFLVKQIRANLIQVMEQDYILLARAKGLSLKQVVTKHALRNALIPLFGYFGKMSANILVGSFIIEKIFCIPGLGYWFVSSVSNRDYPMIMGLTIFYSVILLGALFIAELAHAILDPRLYRRQGTLGA